MRRPLSSINKISFKQTRSRVAKTLKEGIQVNMSTQGSKKLLRSHVNKKTNLVIMFVDINNSTLMSLALTEKKFALIVQTFAQEISIVVEAYGGYVFKYEGDAVIALFPAENDRIKACKNALNCSRSILEIIGKILNPALKTNELSEITVRIGMAYGHALVVLYGKNLDKAHLDILGSSISLASKIASIAKPNQVLVGEHVYNIIKPSVASNSLREVNLDPAKWKYISSSDPDKCDKLIISLRTAVDNDGVLDKESTSYNDIQFGYQTIIKSELTWPGEAYSGGGLLSSVSSNILSYEFSI